MMTFGTGKSLLVPALCSAFLLGIVSVAEAGRGGSDERIRGAIASGSVGAIIAELERAEFLVCGPCIKTVMQLLDDERYEVREVAAWWFARRPAQKKELLERAIGHLYGTDSIKARNAADILSGFRHPDGIDALEQAVSRSDLSAEARKHAVRALGHIGHQRGTVAIAAAMADVDAGVRLEAATAWNEIRQPQGAAPVIVLLGDSNVLVRRKAAAVVGRLREAGARTALEAQSANDEDARARRNAVWALGRIGDPASRPALEVATTDPSRLVRATARAALRMLR